MFIVTLVSFARVGVSSDPSFVIQGFQVTTNGACAITWSTYPGFRNEVLYANSPDQPWQSLPGTVSVAGPSVYSLSYTDYPPVDTTQRFYRVRITRHKLVMSLVLDHSGSMMNNGGAILLPRAVDYFIDLFSENYDSAALVTFSQFANADVTMRTVFKSAISNAAALPFPGSYTCTECGLTNALAQENTVVIPSGDDVIKIIVLFTDGMANTFTYNFNCGMRNISYDDELYNPTNGNISSSGCTIPPKLDSIDPVTGAITTGTVSATGPLQCDDMHYEAQRRAERIAWLARSQGIFVYAIGLGAPSSPGECGDGVFPVLNPDFLNNLANTTNSATYDPSQPSGDFAIAADASGLLNVFQEIAQKALAVSP